MERENTIINKLWKNIVNTNRKEFGVFLLLVFLNLKFVFITIIQNRSFLIDLLVYILLIVTFNYSNWTYKNLFKTFVFLIVYTAINFSPYKLNVLMPLLIIQSISAISFRKYLIYNLIITGSTLLIMYIIFGEGINMVGYSFILDRKTRMSFGFGHPNTAALYYYCFIINILLLLFFSKHKNKIPYYLIFVIPLWFYIYKQTASRSFLLSIITLYGAYCYYYLMPIFYKKISFKIVNYLAIFLILISTVVTVFFALARKHFIKLDLLFSKRLTSYDAFLQKIDILGFFFGTDAYKHYVIDSSYLHLLFEGGIIFFIGFLLFYIISTTNMINKKDWISICVIISFVAYGLMETLLLFNMLIGTNIFWITLYYYYKKGQMKL